MVKVLYPGHNYLGPGNDLDAGTPVDKADEIAQKHDIEYSRATKKQDIFKSDKKAINNFRGDWQKNFNLPSLSGDIGLSIKHFVESNLDRTIYPWNLPNEMGPMKRSAINHFADNEHGREKPYEKYSRQSNPSSDESQVSSSSGMSSQNNGTGEVSQMDTEPSGTSAAVQMTGKGASQMSAHGQTAKIFSGYPQEPNWLYFTKKKTYRFTFKSTLPAVRLRNGIPVFRIGSAVRIPVENLMAYLSPQEVAHLQTYSLVELLHAKCNVFNYGIRLPFTTQEAASVTANASAQYPLCQWIGLEEDYNFYQDRDEVADTINKMIGTFQIPVTDEWTDNFTNLSARSTSREITQEAQICIPQTSATTGWYPNTNEYAHSVNGTMNLGKVFEWEHKIENGMIVQNHSRVQTLPATRTTIVDLQNRATLATVYANSDVTEDPISPTDPKDTVIFKGIGKWTQAQLAADYDRLTIDGWNARALGGDFSPNSKMKPFIVGMQFLRNTDDSILIADWEFALEFYLTYRARDTTCGIYEYNYISAPTYAGIKPLATVGQDTNDEYYIPTADLSSRGKYDYIVYQGNPPTKK